MEGAPVIFHFMADPQHIQDIVASMLVAYTFGALYYGAGVAYTLVLIWRYRPEWRQGLFMLAFVPPMWLLIWRLERMD